jgi:hypothetical protein
LLDIKFNKKKGEPREREKKKKKEKKTPRRHTETLITTPLVSLKISR